jgi:ribosomal protein S27E
MRNWLRNFMIGRYGPDQLYLAMITSAVVLCLISALTRLQVLNLLALLLMALAVARMLSRRIEQRRRENDRFLTVWTPLKYKVKKWFRKQKDRKAYRFFRCPECKNTLRVPKHKGKIQITCPRCGERFVKKT